MNNDVLPDLSPRIYEQIGRVMARWAEIDMLLGQFFAWVLHADSGMALIVTQGVSSGTITDWLRTLIPLRFTHDETRNRILALLNRIDDLRADRNAYAHGVWRHGPEEDTAILDTVRWERSEIIRGELVTVQDATELVGHIFDTRQELLFLGDQLGFHAQVKPAKTSD